MRRLDLILILATLALYGAWLTRSPIYLDDTEVLFGLHARSLAATLRDANGRLLPLYFQMKSIGDNVWFQPMLPYWTAPFLKVLPLSVWAVRMPTALVGVANVALTFFIGRRLFKSDVYAAAAAAFLALMPAHFMHSRIAMDYIYPVPFVLVWLLCLIRFDETGERRLAFAGGLALGIGMGSYLGAVAMMPMYLVFTLLFLLHKYRRADLSLVLVVTGFLVPLVLLAIWLGAHPDVYAGTVARYGASKGGLRQFLHFYIIGDLISLYWNYYNPNYLFLSGGTDIFTSTRRAGVFLIGLAPLLVAGIYDVADGRRGRAGWLVLAGVLTAPLPAVLVGEGSAIYRELEMLPFAALLAVYGLRLLVRSSSRTLRVAALVALVLIPVQFVVFAKNYFSDYRLLSAARFGGNIRAAVGAIVDRDRQRRLPAVFVSDAIAYPRDRVQFYLAEFGDEALLSRVRLLTRQTQSRDVPPGAVVLTPVIDGVPRLNGLAPSDVRAMTTVTEPTGTGSYVVFEK